MLLPFLTGLLCFAALGVWIVYTTLSGIRAILSAFATFLGSTIGGLLAFGIVYLFFSLILVIFVDISILWNFLGENLLTYIVIAFVCAVLLGLYLAFVHPIMRVVAYILGAILLFFDFLEMTVEVGYETIIEKIAKNIDRMRGSQ